jgi:DNA-binding response OmpR family regulator
MRSPLRFQSSDSGYISPNDHVLSQHDDGRTHLNLLLSYGGWRDDTFADLLPRLLEPQGIRCLRARNLSESDHVVRQVRIHIAVVDIGLPVDGTAGESAGPRVLQILRRMDAPPPTVVVRPPQPSLRDQGRSLRDALHEGAFAVLERSCSLETFLDTLRRVVQRHYAGHWPLQPAVGVPRGGHFPG